MKKKKKLPSKASNLLEKIHNCINVGNYRYTGHVQDRLEGREVARQEVKQVLKSGYLKESKDKFDDNYMEWNYAIEGKTLDKRKLRVIVSFDSNNMLIVTVIDLR